jgi:glutamate N-acetyltransferase/amino-acid N-acetyltransferase
MAVGYSELPQLFPINGIRLASTVAGIRYTDRDDLVVVELSNGSKCAAVFTRNVFCAAPVQLAQQHLAQMKPAFLLINSGNANAGTGATGMEAAKQCCVAVAQAFNCKAAAVLPFSTGVIGEQLPVERIESALVQLPERLSSEGWRAAAQAIMTTDTVAKGVSLQVEIGGKTITVTGITKGAGMIRPDMATMLAFIATDAPVEKEFLQTCLQQAADKSFNRITVDGDTSTNDACVLMATGKVDMPQIKTVSADAVKFHQLITDACQKLAQLIIRDAEGATKFVTIAVNGGRDSAECLQVAYTIAHSPLVKTALFASDPNWGRILAAVGRSGLPDLSIEGLEIYLDDACVVRDGGVAEDYIEQRGQTVMDQPEITIRVELGRGNAQECIWTSDLSHDYVSINADYRS